MRRIESVILFALLAWLVVGPSASDAKIAEPKRVLAILFYQEGVPWINLVAESLRKNLAAKSPYPVELNIEYADRARYPDGTYLQKLIELYRYKYVHPPMDVIIGLGDEAADILVETGEAVFGKIPTVIVSANPKVLQRKFLKPHMTSLLWGADIRINVDLIEELFPKTRRLIIWQNLINLPFLQIVAIFVFDTKHKQNIFVVVFHDCNPLFKNTCHTILVRFRKV